MPNTDTLVLESSGRDAWFEAYASIWTGGGYSLEIVERLFTPDAVYRPNVVPSLERHRVGHLAILDYFQSTVPNLSWESLADGGRIDAGDITVGQAWLTGTVDGSPCTEVLCSIYRFASDGRCCEIRDYPIILATIEQPFDGWDR